MLVKELNQLCMRKAILETRLRTKRRELEYYKEQHAHLCEVEAVSGSNIFRAEILGLESTLRKTHLSIGIETQRLDSLDAKINYLKAERERRLKKIRVALVCLVSVVAAVVHFSVWTNMSKPRGSVQGLETVDDMQSFSFGYIVICLATLGVFMWASDYKKY